MEEFDSNFKIFQQVLKSPFFKTLIFTKKILNITIKKKLHENNLGYARNRISDNFNLSSVDPQKDTKSS